MTHEVSSLKSALLPLVIELIIKQSLHRRFHGGRLSSNDTLHDHTRVGDREFDSVVIDEGTARRRQRGCAGQRSEFCAASLVSDQNCTARRYDV